MSVEENRATVSVLRTMGFTHCRDLVSYFHLKGYIQVLGLKSLIACRQPSFVHKEFARETEVFLNTGNGVFLHYRFDCCNELVMAGVVKELQT